MTNTDITYVVGSHEHIMPEPNFIAFVYSYTDEHGVRHQSGVYEDVTYAAALEWAKMKVRWKGRYNVTVVRVD